MRSMRFAWLGPLLAGAALVSDCGARSSLSVAADEEADACAAIVCAAPPAPTCVSPTTLRTSSSPGTCADGACSYPHIDTQCPSGCSAGMCSSTMNRALVSVGTYHTCGITPLGAVKCWGFNGHGQLGNHTTINSPVPTEVQGLGALVLAVSAGTNHTCAITKAGTVECWGDNTYGQLGNDSTNDSTVPVIPVGLEAGALAVSAGYHHTCAITAAGGVKCWGANDYGQLGIPPSIPSQVPVELPELTSGIVTVSAGSHHTCAIRSSGGAVCWGGTGQGELGGSPPGQAESPVEVTGLSEGVVAISARDHSCAVTAASGAMCWGPNSNGELGNGSTIPSNEPVDVTDLSSGVFGISAGAHTCALLTTGGVRCWGANSVGQLGNNSLSQSSVPVDVAGLGSGVVAVSANDFHSCALTASGVMKCWGSNAFGQLGNDSVAVSSIPLDVVGF